MYKEEKRVKNSKNKKAVNIDDISNELINLCGTLENSLTAYDTKLLVLQIRMCEKEIEHLKYSKPYWFQKSKLKKYEVELEKLEDKLIKRYQELNNNLEMMKE